MNPAHRSTRLWLEGIGVLAGMVVIAWAYGLAVAAVGVLIVAVATSRSPRVGPAVWDHWRMTRRRQPGTPRPPA